MDINDKFPSPRGGGSPAYFSGTEVYRDLSSGSFDAGASVADIGKTVVLYSSTDGKSYKLPNANATGMAVGKGTGFRVLPKSKPIKILNQGVAGTDDILEAFPLPGANGALFANSVATAKGDWRGQGAGLFHGAVPRSIPNVQDAGADFGSVLATASVSPVSLLASVNICQLSSTLYVVTGIPAAGTSVVSYAVSYNHTTDAWTWGAAVTSFSSANQWLYPKVVALSATLFAVVAWEATNNKVSARACTVSGTTITQGTTILSGAWSVNPTSSDSTRYASLIADSATTFFFNSRYDGAHLGITHFSVSGTTLTQDGGGAFASSSMPIFNPNGFSPAANIIELALASDNATVGISRYTYAGGAVTNTWDRRDKNNFGNQSVLWSVDPTNRVYYTANGGAGNLSRLVLKSDLSQITEQANFILPVMTDVAAPLSVTPEQLTFLSDDEALVNGVNTSIGSLTLFNPQINIRARAQFPTGTSADTAFAHNTVAAQLGWGPAATTRLGLSVNAANRTVAMFYVFQSQTVASGRAVAMQMFDLPRNYDGSIQ